MSLQTGHIREDEESLLPQPTTTGFPAPSPSDPACSPWNLSRLIPTRSFDLNGNEKILRSISTQNFVTRCLTFMLPSFISWGSDPDNTASTPKREGQTEYLDGVRGVASLIVFIFHWSDRVYPSISTGWGYKENYSPLLLPYIRLLHSGPGMVAIFFVISGFVLSHRFIQRMHRREYSRMHSGLSSIIFRRAIRLFLPSCASSVIVFICVSMGAIKIPKQFNGHPFYHGFPAFADFLDVVTNPWDWETILGFYNPQLWTISSEFRGS